MHEEIGMDERAKVMMGDAVEWMKRDKWILDR